MIIKYYYRFFPFFRAEWEFERKNPFYTPIIPKFPRKTAFFVKNPGIKFEKSLDNGAIHRL